MPIKMTMERGRADGRTDITCAEVHCDLCRQRIVHGRDGNYEWEVDHGTAEPTTGTLFFTHKHCSNAFRLANGEREGRWWFSMELGELPIYLGRNLGLDIGALVKIDRQVTECPL